MIKYKIQDIAIIRRIYEKIDFNTLNNLKEIYDYIYLVSYNYINTQGLNISVFEKKTPIIHLNKSFDDIFINFKSNTKNEIRKTFKIEGLNFVNFDKNYEEIFNLNKLFETNKGWKPTIIDEFKNGNTFSAYYKNELMAFVFCNIDNNIIRVTNIASNRKKNSNEYNKIIGYSTRRLIYEICKWGLDNNIVFVDLGIINFTDPSKKGIAKFKSSFGADIIDTYIYRYKNKKFLDLKTDFHIH